MNRTALYSTQAKLHAKFGAFGGWELPIYYRSILEEHEAVRTRAGLFDVSHLGHLEAAGPSPEGAGSPLSQLQPLVTQDLSRIPSGRACYTPMLRPEGSILDEMILYRLDPRRIRLVVNAANGDKVLSWVRSNLKPPVEIRDLRESVGTLALQGPKAVPLFKQAAGESFQDLPRYGVREARIEGKSFWAARTGYTGEDGFELFVPAEDLEFVWSSLLAAGRPFGVQPVGLGARDTLRLEAGLPLGGSDLDEETTPLEAGLEWTVSWGKGSFVGREALERQKKEGLRRRLVGFRLKAEGIPRHGYMILQGGKRVGLVTSGTFLPSRRFGIGMGYVPPGLSVPGTRIEIQIHGRDVPAEVVQLPFYRRG
ncbi:MAG: glycine cleavage system aminomethyltransferase GcvT [Candidatus Omnitrophica bacterium]|nr:glycine cleavage system aminomethyltransferase GcvT [Candidatus Omnitrophota bacterium]